MDSKIVSCLFQGLAVVCMGGIDGTVTYPFALYFSNYLRERRSCREPLNSRYFFYYPFLTQQGLYGVHKPLSPEDYSSLEFPPRRLFLHPRDDELSVEVLCLPCVVVKLREDPVDAEKLTWSFQSCHDLEAELNASSRWPAQVLYKKRLDPNFPIFGP